MSILLQVILIIPLCCAPFLAGKEARSLEINRVSKVCGECWKGHKASLTSEAGNPQYDPSSCFPDLYKDFDAGRNHQREPGGEEVEEGNLASIWFFAEGCTRMPFEEIIYIYNPNQIDAHIKLTCISPQGNAYDSFTLSSEYRVNLHLNYWEEAVDKDLSVVVHSRDESGNPLGVVCERVMYLKKKAGDPGPADEYSGYSSSGLLDWDERSDGHCSLGITHTGREWYFAEGCTDHGFETWFLLLNPHPEEAKATLTFYAVDGNCRKKSVMIPPWSRKSVEAGKVLPNEDFSAMVESDRPIVVERSMYWDDTRGGHCSFGCTAPSDSWYAAEGSTAWGFDNWLLIFNPREQVADLELQFMSDAGPGTKVNIEVAPRSRRTIHANDVFPYMDGPVAISSMNGAEIVCERSMYWQAIGHRSGHCSGLSESAARDWYLAEGEVRRWPGLEPYLLVSNPTDRKFYIEILVNTPYGVFTWDTKPVMWPKSRVTIPFSSFIRNMQMCLEVHVLGENPADKVVVERAEYWCGRYGGHVSMSYAPWVSE